MRIPDGKSMDSSQFSSQMNVKAIENGRKAGNYATYYLSDPIKTDPNGSIKVEERSRLVNSGTYAGAASTLSNARLFSFYQPIEKELFEKEKEYRKLVFDDSGFINQFANDYMLNWYNLQKSQSIYRMHKAQQEGNSVEAGAYQYEIDQLNKKIDNYVQPENTLINVMSKLVVISVVDHTNLFIWVGAMLLFAILKVSKISATSNAFSNSFSRIAFWTIASSLLTLLFASAIFSILQRSYVSFCSILLQN
jgi:hypothetical protein